MKKENEKFVVFFVLLITFLDIGFGVTFDNFIYFKLMKLTTASKVVHTLVIAEVSVLSIVLLRL